VNHRPAARETTKPLYQRLHLLQHVCREISTVCSRSPTAPSVPVRPRSVTHRHQSNGKAGRAASFVARRADGLPHLGTFVSGPPAFQSVPPHTHSFGQLYTAGTPFSAGPHRPREAPSDVSGLHILPHCSRPYYPLARSLPHPGHHSRHRGTPLLECWISRFGSLQTITTDQGRPFQSLLFQFLARLCGIQVSRTNAPHSAANGLEERFHQTLQPSCAKRTNSGQRRFPWFSSESARHSKKTYRYE
jgi:hypothetical protein